MADCRWAVSLYPNTGTYQTEFVDKATQYARHHIQIVFRRRKVHSLQISKLCAREYVYILCIAAVFVALRKLCGYSLPVMLEYPFFSCFLCLVSVRFHSSSSHEALPIMTSNPTPLVLVGSMRTTTWTSSSAWRSCSWMRSCTESVRASQCTTNYIASSTLIAP